MPVDLIHIIIGLSFLTMWVVISQFAFGHQDETSSAPPRHRSTTVPPPARMTDRAQSRTQRASKRAIPRL